MAKNDPMLLLHVPSLMPEAQKYCAQRESKFPYFRDGYVNASLGRDTGWTHAIRQATEGYAIADATGTVQATYRNLKNAERALANAKPRFLTELELEPDEPTAAPKSKTASASVGA